MADTTKPTIFFLGATGGCAFSTLVRALQDGYHCTALTRTPSKLTSLLENAGIASSTIDSYLTITAGDATAIPSLKEALLNSSNNQKLLPSIIVSGLGGLPKMRFGLPPFTIDQPTICEDAASALVNALSEIYVEDPSLLSAKPLLCYISTGGMYRGEDDITWVNRMLYSYLLSVPWQDKKAMEKVFNSDTGRETFKSTIAVKVSLLTDGPELGSDAVRVGTRTQPELGYSISRKDVGGWIYRNVLMSGGKDWEGELVSLTY